MTASQELEDDERLPLLGNNNGGASTSTSRRVRGRGLRIQQHVWLLHVKLYLYLALFVESIC